MHGHIQWGPIEWVHVSTNVAVAACFVWPIAKYKTVCMAYIATNMLYWWLSWLDCLYLAIGAQCVKCHTLAVHTARRN